MSLPTAAIIGRPNVGKSSLFNRLIKKRKAVVDPQPGVTRDRNYAICDWAGRTFRLVDTGGLVPDSDDMMERLIHDQSEFAIHEADLILLVVDTQTGADAIDMKLARKLSRSGKPSLVIANKADNDQLASSIHDFHRLGLGEPIPVSATVGLGIGELLDIVAEKLPQIEVGEREPGEIRVAVVGRPNVGKSSFINKILGENRLIVSRQAGTTRDSVDSVIQIGDNRYVLIDTAGIRRQYKVHENIEFYTNLRATRAIDDSDVAVVIIDAVDAVTSQDQRILAQVLENRRAAVLVVNKWDLIEKDGRTADQFSRSIKEVLAQYAYLPIIYVSALSGQRVRKVLELVLTVYTEHSREIPTSELNDFLQSAVSRLHPPARRGKFLQLKYVTQTETKPPTFVFFVNHPQLLDKTYIYYLTNRLRDEFGFSGVPIRLKFRKK